jgi:hypothetical protein
MDHEPQQPGVPNGRLLWLGWKQPGVPNDGLLLGWKIVVHADGNALADAADCADAAAFSARKRWLDGAEKKNAVQPHLFERLAKDACLECGNVGGYVGKFRHGSFPRSLYVDAQEASFGAGFVEREKQSALHESIIRSKS